MKLSKAVEGYLLFASTKYAAATVEHYQKTLIKVIEHLNDPDVETISVQDLQRYFIFLKTQYKPHRFLGAGQEPRIMSDAGLEGYWKALRSFFEWAEQSLQTSRPDKAIPQPKYRLPEVKAFTPEEMKKLLYAAEWKDATRKETNKTYRMHRSTYKRDVALIKFMLDTGLRVGEICRVKFRDINLQSGQVIVAPFGSGQKTKPRTVFLGKSANHSVWLYSASKDFEPDDSFFGLIEKSIRQLLRSIGEKAEVKNVHPHRFRHTFAIEFLRNQRDPFTLMRLLGHSNLQMTNHYLELLDTDLARFHKSGSPVDNNKL